MKVRKINTFSLKDILMGFLLHLNEDFDDDLLADAIKMMIDI